MTSYGRRNPHWAGRAMIQERAKVEVWPDFGIWGKRKWLAHHDECDWFEELDEWHNAFWAADHHVRYDCGRREQMSSGSYTIGSWGGDIPEREVSVGGHAKPRTFDEHYRAELAAGEPICFCGTPWSQHGTDRYGGYTVTADCMPPDPVDKPYLRKNGPIEAAYEGGMQNTPTPPHTGFPLGGEYAEGPTAEMGAITTEVGQVGDDPWEGFPLEGHTQGRTRGGVAGEQGVGHTGWWAGLWGRA